MKLNDDGLPEFEDDDFAIRMSETNATLRNRANRLLHAWLKAQPRVWGFDVDDEDMISSWFDDLRTIDTHTAYLVGIRKIGEGEARLVGIRKAESGK